MKRMGTIFIILVILYSTYYDLTIGTLPNGVAEATETIPEEKEGSTSNQTEGKATSLVELDPFQEVTVEPGQTVLSIVEHLHEGTIKATIQEIVYDFQELNGGIRPEEIQIGKTYFFPVYR